MFGVHLLLDCRLPFPFAVDLFTIHPENFSNSFQKGFQPFSVFTQMAFKEFFFMEDKHSLCQ